MNNSPLCISPQGETSPGCSLCPPLEGDLGGGKDEIKQYKLENAGFKVLRYNDEDVLENMENVLLDIEQHIKKLR